MWGYVLQYIGGFVILQLYKKKNSKNNSKSQKYSSSAYFE